MEIDKMLSRYGLNTDAIKIYKHLSKYGPSTALSLSKSLKISRTQVYRHLEKLEEMFLVNQQLINNSTTFYAEPITNLQTTITSKTLEIEQLKNDFNELTNYFTNISESNTHGVNIKQLTGIHGIRHALLNLLKAENEFKVLEKDHLSNLVDEHFTINFRQTVIKNDITSYDITNKKKIFIKELEPIKIENVNYCYIPKNILDISFEILLYNETVTFINYEKDNLYALELTNKPIYIIMNGLYNCIWSFGKKINPV